MRDLHARECAQVSGGLTTKETAFVVVVVVVGLILACYGANKVNNYLNQNLTLT